MQGHVSSWIELTDSTSVRKLKAIVAALGKLVVKDSDFECVNFAFDEATQRLLRYEAVYWDAKPPDYPKLFRRTSRCLYPGEWLLFEEKRSMTFVSDCSTLNVILVAKEVVYTIGGNRLGDALHRRMTGLGLASPSDEDVSSFQES